MGFIGKLFGLVLLAAIVWVSWLVYRKAASPASAPPLPPAVVIPAPPVVESTPRPRGSSIFDDSTDGDGARLQSRDLPSPSPSPAAAPAPPIAIVGNDPLAPQIDSALDRTARAARTVTLAEAACLGRLNSSADYQAALAEKSMASAAVRDAGSADEVRRLALATQALADLRRRALLSDAAIAAAKKIAVKDEDDLVALLHRQGTVIVSEPRADGTSSLSHTANSGGTQGAYMRGYTRQDGTYVAGHYRK